MARIVKPRPEHQVLYADIAALLQKNLTAEISAEETLAIAANFVGKLIAMQDQRTMSVERAMETVIKNIEVGNEEAFAMLGNTKGSA